ncbi:MAG: hypothetical protein OEX02_19780, partial [Cyclobacteriaceae bacterium]|nr:hypothetical protein [Cyclobacteriaceae bacterium]
MPIADKNRKLVVSSKILAIPFILATLLFWFLPYLIIRKGFTIIEYIEITWYMILFHYLWFIQIRLIKINVYNDDSLSVRYVLMPFIKEKVFYFHDLDKIEYSQNRGARYGTSFFKIYTKRGRPKKYHLSDFLRIKEVLSIMEQ